MNLSIRVKIILICLIFISQLAFSDNSIEENKFINIDISISPTIDGLLDGKVFIELNWLPYLSSGLLFTSNGFNQVISEGNANYTIISSSKSIVFNALKMNEELLWQLIKTNIDFIDFYIGVIAKWVISTTKEYGYKENVSPSYFYIENNELNYIKPLFIFGLGINFLFMNINSYSEITPIAVTENITGNFINSIDNKKKDFFIDDLGFDSRYGGNISLKTDIINILFNIEFYRHIGYSKKYFGTVFNEYAYEAIDLSLSLNLELYFLKYIGSIPNIGFTFIQHSFNPASTQYGILQYTNNRYRIDIGFKY